MKKRILALVLAFTMATSLSYTALAETMPATGAAASSVATGNEDFVESKEDSSQLQTDAGSDGDLGEDGEESESSSEEDTSPDVDSLVEDSVDAEQGADVKTVTAWTWNDTEGLLQQDGDVWGLGLAGVSELDDDTWAQVQQLLPQSILATLDDGSETVVLSLSWTLEGTSAVASLVDEGYVLSQDLPTLTVTLQLGEADTLAVSQDQLARHIVDAPGSIVGTTIDVFDYWLQDQTSSDTTNPTNYYNLGINAGHYLLFANTANNAATASLQGTNASGNSTYNNNGNWNGWTGAASGPINGIVSRLLDAGGYPTLALQDTRWQNAISAATSLSGRSPTESLAYLFDPDVEIAGKASYEDVGGLLQIDDEGYYYYNSQENFASLVDGNYENFVLYDTWAVTKGGLSPDGQFFPFNSGTTVFTAESRDGLSSSIASNDSSINHYFGVHMQTRFLQQYGGYTKEDGGEAVTYDFSGDDDVWIYIDGVLVADLGGIHDAVSVNIDFSTGSITISSANTDTSTTKFTAYTTTLLDQFQAAGEESSVAWRGYTFADNTYHTLDFFYLERGNVDSNMYLKYNLVTVPESSIIKVDQTGDAVAGATFELYTADANYAEQTKIASGTTSSDGQFVLVDDEGYIVSLQDVWNNMSTSGLTYTAADGQKRANLILKETSTPAGYRSADEVRLYLVNSNDNVILLSDNYWETGAYAYANATVSTDGTITYNDYNNGGTANLANGGILFAVVLRRNVTEGGTPTTDTWSLVTGNATEGWKTSEELVSGATGIQTILTTLQSNSSNYYVAQLDSSGAYKLTVTDLPGDILKYYYMLDDESKNDAEYTIAFYYTTADSVSSATSDNTWRVTNSDSWSRVFSSNVYVPNIKNRLFVQKFSDTGETLTGATFALYAADDITVNEDGTYTIGVNATPYDTVTTADLTKDTNGIELAGGGIFPSTGNVLEEGTYYLVETAAPDGYDINTTPVMVIVDSTGVYADAGDSDDGISVARGVGSIVKSMAQFASMGDIDATLNNIVAKFYTVSSDTIDGTTTDFEDFVWRTAVGGEFVASDGVTYTPTYWYYEDDDGVEHYEPYDLDNKPADDAVALGMHLKYSTDASLEYAAVSGGGIFVMTTDVGWSKLMIEQCYQHSQEMADQGYNVTDLTSPTLYDLTNLFSGTVVVQVTNDTHYDTALTITKAVDGVTDEDVAEETFTFQVTSSNSAYNGQVTVKIGDSTSSQSFSNGVLEVSVTGVGSIQILNLAEGTYTVTESSPNASVVTQDGSKYNWTGVDYQGGSGASDNVVTIAASADDAEKAITVTNTYAQDFEVLTVTKTVGGNMGDTTQNFSFTLVVTQGDVAYTDGLSAQKGDTSTALSFDTSTGGYTFELKDSETMEISIPYGCQVTVTETAADGYTTQSRQYLTGSEAPNYGEAANPYTQTVASLDAGYTIDYLNSRSLETPTGVSSQSSAYIAMIVVAALGVLAIGGSGFLVWRRRRGQWR